MSRRRRRLARAILARTERETQTFTAAGAVADYTDDLKRVMVYFGWPWAFDPPGEEPYGYVWARREQVTSPNGDTLTGDAVTVHVGSQPTTARFFLDASRHGVPDQSRTVHVLNIASFAVSRLCNFSQESGARTG